MSSPDEDRPDRLLPSAPGPISWMAMNAVAANLLMLALLIGGVLGLSTITKEIFPPFHTDTVTVSVAYPGASPEEINDGIILAIEAQVRTLPGIGRVFSSATEGSGSVSLDVISGHDRDQVLLDVRNAVDRITSFPDDAETPDVTINDFQRYVVSLGVTSQFGDQSLFALKTQAIDRILALPGVAEVVERGEAVPEIRIEVPRERLRELDLTLEEVAAAVRSAARDLPGGGIITSGGEILLRTDGRRVRGPDFLDIPILVRADGSRILLGDVARVVDGFEDLGSVIEYNGRSGVRLDVFQGEGAEPLEISAGVRGIVAEINAGLPEGASVTVSNDRSERFGERIGLLVKNGALGLTLVVITLGVFLNLRVAFWVAVSIPVVLIGSFSFLPWTGISINMVSMFAFIMTLGIVVDDSIIVGENIHARVQDGLPVPDAVRQGVLEMAVPVLFAVVTNIIAFVPLLLIPGLAGQMMLALPIVACVVFAVSLVEALFILPAHLNGDGLATKPAQGPFRRVMLFRQAVAGSLDLVRDTVFLWLVRRAVSFRYLTVVLFTGVVALVWAYNASGRIDLVWNPEIPGNRVDAEFEMPVDATIDDTLEVARRIEAAAFRTLDRLGDQDDLASWTVRAGIWRPTSADVNMTLVPDGERPFTQAEFTRVWREEIGPVPEVDSLFFEFLVGPGGARSLRVSLSHPDDDLLETAALDLADRLRGFTGVVDVTSGVGEGKQQTRFLVTPEGQALGLDEQSLGQQVRGAFQGAEAFRLLRDGREVRVIATLPLAERDSRADLDAFIIRTPDGVEVPLGTAARTETGRAFTTIERENGRRTLTVIASVDPDTGNSRVIREALQGEVMPALRALYPGLDLAFSERTGVGAALQAVLWGFLAVLVVIYALMASLFRSYVQGVLVVLTIPFSLAAAIIGHIAMGFDISAVSVFGMIGLAGMVVNGALVLTLRYNALRERVDDATEAVIQAARARFRPIVLTSFTTTVGLAPMLFETSVQAQFLIPLAVVLTFGTVLSTFAVLFLIPALHAIHADVGRLLGGAPRPAPAPAE